MNLVNLLDARGLGRRGDYQQSIENKRSALYSTVLSSVKIIQNLQLTNILAGHLGCVNIISFTEDGSLAITGSDDLTIQLHNIHTNELTLKITTAHRGNIFDVKEIPNTDCHQFLSCAGDGRILLTTLSDTGVQTTKMICRHKGRSHRIKFLPCDTNVFYSCGEDGYCYLHDLRDPSYFPIQSSLADIPIRNNCIEFCDHHMRCSIFSIDINPLVPHHLAVGGDNESAKVYDTRNLSSSESLTTPIAEYFPGVSILPHRFDDFYGVSGLQFHGNGKEILVSYNSDYIFRYDLHTHNRLNSPFDLDESEYLTVYKGHRNRQTIKQVTYWSSHDSLSFPHGSTSRDYVLSGSDSGHIFIWDRETGSIVKVLIGSTVPVNCITPHKELPLIASGGIERTVKLWYPHGLKAWSGHPVPSYSSKFVREKERIEEEIAQEEEQRRVEEDLVAMLIRNSSYSDSESSRDSYSESDDESDSSESDRDSDREGDGNRGPETFGETIQNHPLSSEVGNRRRSYSEMERGHEEIGSDGVEVEGEEREERERHLRLRRYLTESYGRLSELDREACAREGVSQDSDSDIYAMESDDEIELTEDSSSEDSGGYQIESEMSDPETESNESSSDGIVDPDIIRANIEEIEDQEESESREIEYQAVD